MTKLEWNRPGSRLFENGIDQAVLFVDNGPGVPWSGMIGITNKATSGETRDVYIDGVKANSEATIEEYVGTLEALFYPNEFEACDGLGYDLDSLVRIGQQTRKPFHLAYRSWVGNDLDGQQSEYKIHLLYNLHVMPSKRKFKSLARDVELQTFSWDLSSIPEPVPGYLPTSHLIFESSKLYPKILQQLEEIIFGGYYTDSRMPMPTEVVNLVGDYLPVRLIQNKSATTRINLFDNARAESTSGFASSNGQADVSYVPGVGVRYDIVTTAPVNIGISAAFLTTGQQNRLLIRARANRNLEPRPRLRATTGDRVFLEEEWKWFDYTGVVGSGASIQNGFVLDSASGHAPGDFVLIDRVLIAAAGDTGPWFDENSPPGDFVAGLHSHLVLGVRDPDLEGDLIKLMAPGLYRRPTSTRLFETAGPGLFTLQEG